MGSRCLSELLLRPSPYRIPLAAQTSTSVCQRLQPLCLSRRTFSACASLRATRPADEPTPAAQSQSDDSNTARSPFDDMLTKSRRSRTQQSDAAVSSAIDSLFSRGTDLAPRRSEMSSSDEFAAAARNRSFGADFSKPGKHLGRRPLKFDDMLDMPSDKLAQKRPKIPVIKEEDIVYPRLNASTGRAVDLEPSRGYDIVRGLNMLSSLMARNKVRKDATKQKFHERPGLKRKRLKSERWRARFKVGFHATCQRVSDLTRKGW